MSGAPTGLPDLHRIDRPDDPRLGDYVALTDAVLRKRYEHQHGVLIAEGPNPVRALLASPYPVRSVLVAEQRVEPLRELLTGVAAPVYVVSQPVLEEVVRFRLHQGVLACGQRLPPADPQAVTAGADRVLLLEGLNDHENLGALFRTARALRVGGVLLGPGCADPLYRRSVRVSMGHVLHVPFARTGPVVPAIEALRDAGFLVVALTPAPDARDVDDPALTAGRLALLLGAEGPGLTGRAMEAADLRVRIPIEPAVDSLNVAAAAAIALHATRPR